LTFDAHVTRGKGPTKGIVWTNPQLSSAASAAKDEALNLVLVSIDTLRADHLGCYGYDKQTSPNIDRMAQAGILFRQATAASSWTLPSHASLFSGLVPSRHGARLGFATPIPPEVRMLAEPLWETYKRLKDTKLSGPVRDALQAALVQLNFVAGRNQLLDRESELRTANAALEALTPLGHLGGIQAIAAKECAAPGIAAWIGIILLQDELALSGAQAQACRWCG